MNYFAYMLRCGDNTIYSGYTNDLEKRLHAHNSGLGARYTRCRLPVELLYYEAFESKSDAMKREAAFKKMTREKKEKLVRSFKAKL